MHLFAQQDSSRTLEEVIVTANRFPQKQNTTGKVVSVIPRAVIERSSGMNLGELLQQQAGIAIAGANNTLGTNQDVYLRGAATGNTLILIDGVPAYDPSTIASTFDINVMPVDELERIEILRGAASTLYGSDAVAGVINLITRRQEEKPVRFYGNVAGGSFETARLLAGMRGKSDGIEYQLQYQRQTSRGFSAAYDSTGLADFDQDGFSQQTFQGSFQAPLTKRLRWRSNAQWGDYDTDLDAGGFRDEQDFTASTQNIQLGTGLDYTGKGWALHANYNYNSSERRYLNDSLDKPGFTTFSREKYIGRAHFAELYGTWNLSQSISLLAGTDYRWQETQQNFFSVSSFGPFETELSPDSARMRIYSAYASAFLRTEKGFFLEAGARYNRHNRFGDALTYSLNPSFSWKNRWKVFFNLASAFKAPSLYQMYDGAVGNPGLAPERSVTGETGIQYSDPGGGFSTRIVLFARTIRDGIDFSFVDFRYFNNNRQRDHGLEWEATYRKGRWNLQGNYSYVKGEVNTTKYVFDPVNFVYVADGDTTFNNLFRRPRHSVNGSIGFQATRALYLRLSARFVGERLEPRFMDSPLTLDPYQTFDLYGEYKIAPQCTFFLDLRNLLDETYFDVAGFNTRPRNFMAGVRVTL